MCTLSETLKQGESNGCGMLAAEGLVEGQVKMEVSLRELLDQRDFEDEEEASEVARLRWVRSKKNGCTS